MTTFRRDHFQNSLQSPLILAVIPAYNKSANIRQVIGETSKPVKHAIVLNGGPIDKTRDIPSNMNAIVFSNKLFGKGFPLKTSIVVCIKYNADVVVTIDADG